MKTLFSSLVAFCFFVSTSCGVEIELPGLGVLEGTTGTTAWTNRTIYKFQTIKYGKSPSGERRFAPPIPVGPWDGTYDATSSGIECPQENTIKKYSQDPEGIDIEDCLSLNVFTPKLPQHNGDDKLLPVMFYIHGGAFKHGDKDEFPPDYLLEHDVILVVIQYRLHVFGFMALETESMPGNVAFLDQLLALRWVNRYIKHFNGDNKRVTIFGQSAGACSVSLQVISTMVEPELFQQAIVQSGASFASWAYDYNVKNTTWYIYRSLMGDENDKVDETVMEKALKKSSVIDLLNAVKKATNSYPWLNKKIGRAIIQKGNYVKFLVDHPANLIKKGLYKSVPMMAGVTKNDGSFLVVEAYDELEATNTQNDDYTLRHDLGKFYMSSIEDSTGTAENLIKNVYFKKVFDKPTITFKDIAPGLTDIIGTLYLKGQTFKQAHVNAKRASETYLYSLHYRGTNTRFGFGKDTSKYPFTGGVHHSDDLLYLFPYAYTQPFNDEDTRMAKIISDLWANFAINGKPTSPLLNTKWLPIEKHKNGPYLQINSTSQMVDDFVDVEFKITSKEAGLL